MDHLPVPEVKIDLDISIPLVATSPLTSNHRPFDSFLASRGLDADADGLITFAQLTARPVLESLDIIQSWLYFALLAQIFSYRGFKMPNLLSGRLDDSGRMIITSKPLVQLFKEEYWLPWLDDFRANRTISTSILRIWDMAYKQCNIFDQPWPEAGTLGLKIILSVRVLLESLLILRDLDLRRRLWYISSGTPTRSLHMFLQQQVIRQNWCSHQLKRIQHDGSYSSTLYLCQLKRLPKRPGWPANCDISSPCSCYHFDREAFTYPHLSEGCDCRSIQPCVADMLGILRAGGIPLVKMTTEYMRGDREIVSAEYVRATPGLQFVAISHVWADNLGHPEAGKIHECQLQRVLDGIVSAQKRRAHESMKVALSRLLLTNRKSTTDTFYIWVDFFCIPQRRTTQVDSNNLSSSWQSQATLESQANPGGMSDHDIAMKLMPAAYSWADFVLVLDNELKLVTRGLSLLEVEARRTVCGWNSRYWTLQEASLCKRTCALYKDTCYPVETLVVNEVRYLLRLATAWATNVCRHFSKPFPERVGHVPEEPRPRIFVSYPYDYVERYLVETIRGMEGIIATPAEVLSSKLTNAKAYNFGYIWSQLSWRSTTRSEDALRILATLHNLDPKEIELLDSETQMRAILRAQEALPFALFTAPLSRNDRMGDAKEERWVPKALSHHLKVSPFAFRVEDDGLVIIPPKRARWFNNPPPYLPKHDLLMVNRPDLHDGTLSLMWNNSTYIRVVALRGFERLATYETVILILECPNELSPTLPMLRSRGQGACFMLERFEGEDMHVSFESPVSWTLAEDNASPETVHWNATKSFRSHSLEPCRIIIDCCEFLARYVIYSLIRSLAIRSWPHLHGRRDVLYRSLVKRYKSAFYILTFLMLLIIIAFPFMFGIFYVREGDIGYIVLIVIFLFPLAWRIALHGALLRSALAYVSMHLHASNGGNDLTWPFWRQLDAALPPLRDWKSAPNLLHLVMLKLYIFAARSLDVVVQFVTCRWM